MLIEQDTKNYGVTTENVSLGVLLHCEVFLFRDWAGLGNTKGTPLLHKCNALSYETRYQDEG